MATLTPIKAIRAKCLDCAGDSSNDVRDCVITECPLYAYRLGKNPRIKREVSEEERVRRADRMKAMWEKKRDEK